jgi:regulation of enolase protein 1 (concanavalin A-like superfamily)
MADFKFANSLAEVPGKARLPEEFTITASPSTDIWSKPPSVERFNAPILYKYVPLTTFERARASFSANWAHQYDQGGLIIVLNYANGSRKWVKTGIELTHGKPHLSTVTKDRWADWSLYPVTLEGDGTTTIEIIRDQENTMWIYLLKDGQKYPLREITWVFEEGVTVTDFWVGVYAAKPSSEGGDLVVKFGSVVIDVSQ